jgi:amino acid transporter
MTAEKQTSARDTTVDGGAHGRPASGLRAGAIGGLAAGVMAAAFSAPSTSMFFNSPFAALHAGKAMTAAFLVSAIAIGFVAFNIASFSSKLPSSGYAYTFVSHGLGPKAGFVSAWMTLLVFIGTPIIVPPYFGTTLSSLIASLTGVHIHWAILALLLLAFVGTLAVLGISDSLKVSAVFVVIELAAVAAFAVYMIVKTPHGQAPSAFSPTSAPSIGAFALAMIFCILSFQGFESAATLGEETSHARVTVPRALLGAIVVTGLFYTFTSYAAVVGWGAADMDKYAADTSNASPWITLAHTYAGSWLADVFAAVVAAGLLAGTIAGVNASARMLFAMGREGVLPSALGVANPRTRTPVYAALVAVIIGGLGGVIAGLVWTPLQVWGFFGSIIGLGAVIVYIMVSLGVIPFFRREHPQEFSVLKHLAVPVVAIAILLVPLLIKNGLIWPLPPWPYNLVPYLTAAWLVVGAIIVAFLQAKRPERLQRAGRIVVDDDPATG